MYIDVFQQNNMRNRIIFFSATRTLIGRLELKIEVNRSPKSVH